MRSPRRRSSRDSQPTPSPPGDAHTIALSIADCGGITVAVHKRNSEDTQWKTIGRNLIAYWAGDAGSIQCYLDAVAKNFPDTRQVTLGDLISLNETSRSRSQVLPLDGWIGDPITVIVRDRCDTSASYRNHLWMEVSKDCIQMNYVTQQSSAIGTGAPYARKLLQKFSSVSSCEMFGADEKLREHIVSRVVHKAMSKSTYNEGFCEIIRGSRTQGWKVIKQIDLEDILLKYQAPNITSLKKELAVA